MACLQFPLFSQTTNKVYVMPNHQYLKTNLLNWYNLIPVSKDVLINSTLHIFFVDDLLNGDTLNYCTSKINFDKNGLPSSCIKINPSTSFPDTIYYTFDKQMRLISQVEISKFGKLASKIDYYRNSVVTTTQKLYEADTSILIETFNLKRDRIKSYKVEGLKTCELSTFEYQNNNLYINNFVTCNELEKKTTTYNIISLQSGMIINFTYPRGDSDYINIQFNENGSVASINYLNIYEEPISFLYIYDELDRISELLCYKIDICSNNITTKLNLEYSYKFVYYKN